jgi:alpha-glucoside transport system permease protein
VTSTAIREEFPPQPAGTPPARGKGKSWRERGVAFGFLAPAVFFLSVWLIYPAIRTAIRSTYSDRGDDFVGLGNYKRMFQDDVIFTAIKNNALWALVVPASVTAVGLILAVLTERVRWSVALKISLFMPLAISLFAVGVIWRIMYQQDPERGAVNAGISSVRGLWANDGVLSRGSPSTDALTGSAQRGYVLKTPVRVGGVARLGLTAIPATDLPEQPKDALQPAPLADGIVGTVWRDFKPGGGTPGKVEPGEPGIAGATVDLRDANGKKVDSTVTEADGSFRFENLSAGAYRVAINKQTFGVPWKGVNWLGDQLITPALWIAYIWVTAGFAMVIIAAGLASIPRDVLEAARTDGASELQVFRRVTVPLLAPVLTVVFVTQIIGVLKVFDLIVSVAPGSSQDDATVLAFEMWRRSFSGQNLFGLGAAISTFLLLLFVPFLVSQVRRFKTEAS